jgi:DNA topoisomerase I
MGSEDYAERNESYGLTTMLREHVTVGERELLFDFPAKSGQRRVQEITDSHAVAIVAALKRRRGDPHLFAYRAGAEWVALHAEDVNAYIKHNTGGAFTAKDFRTWNASVPTLERLDGPDLADRRVRARIETAVLELLGDR